MNWNSREPRWSDGSKSNIEPKKFVVNGQKFDRIPYGKGEDDFDFPTCDDCGTKRGNIHRLGCDLEPCPRCNGQAISCNCFYEDD